MQPQGYPLLLAAAGVVTLAAAPVQILVAAEYLSVEGAQHAAFPQADHFEQVVLVLDADSTRSVSQLAGPQPPHRSLRAWRAMRGAGLLGHVFVDEVLGRQDMITYAVGIDAAGHLGTLEVLAYRESHGGEIRSEAWRRQFQGRHELEAVRFRTDIKNIAGATLSAQHVTQGVRWLLALWQVSLRETAQPGGNAAPSANNPRIAR